MPFGWQDAIVTVIALASASVVVWRTLGHWRDSGPAGTSPKCDNCAVKDRS